MRWFLLQLLIRFAIVLLHVISLAACATFLAMLNAKGSVNGIAIFWIFVLQCLAEGWAVCAYLRYRNGRREEVHQLIRASVSSRVPLEPALHQYLQERQSDSVTWFLQLFFAVLITPLVPCALFIWGWLHLRRFDRQMRQFEAELYDGVPLDDAVLRHPAVLNSESRLAVRVGMTTGKLELALDRTDHEPTGTPWLEIVPRIFYPLFVLFIISSVSTFSLLTLIPKLSRICSEMDTPLPPVTRWLIEFGSFFDVYSAIMSLATFTFIVLLVVATISSTLCWHLPIVGYFYRREYRGRTLRMLGLLLEAEVPAPDALVLLAESEELPFVVSERLLDAAADAVAGSPLTDALRDVGLLTRSMVPLVEAGQKAGTLPWSLRQFGEYESRSALRRATRISHCVGPLLLLVIGVIVAFTSLSIFMPFIAILEKLSVP